VRVNVDPHVSVLPSGRDSGVVGGGNCHGPFGNSNQAPERFVVSHHGQSCLPAWVTWNDDANRLLAPLLGISALPVVTMPQPPFEPCDKVPQKADLINGSLQDKPHPSRLVQKDADPSPVAVPAVTIKLPDCAAKI
jgi:hypothetical protein